MRTLPRNYSSQFEHELSSLVQLLRWRAKGQPGQIAYTFIAEGEQEEGSLTYGALDRRARAIASLLQSYSLKGKNALLLYPPGLEYIAAFFGCLYAQAVAVPGYPPRARRMLNRLVSIAADCKPEIVLTTEDVWSRARPLIMQTPELQSLRWQLTDSLQDNLGDDWSEPPVDRETLALLQYTSGSTSTPKGVMVSHGNLLHNQAMIRRVFRQNERSLIVSWLPLHHDMGLIGNVIQPLYAGARCVLLSPAAFLQVPLRWLQAISKYRATTSGGPNFAYDLCARAIPAEKRKELDLSSWEVAFNGAEPVREETLSLFTRTFESCGFRREAFSPCYGLAEATLLVSGKSNRRPPAVKEMSAADLANNRVIEATAGSANAKLLVGCGGNLGNQQITIVNPERLTECADNEIGEIWVSGPSVAQGYWNRPQETEETFQARLADTGAGPFLRTGDLGFWRDGELFVTGRHKDLIIIRGMNHYPQDIELSAERCHSALRPGCGAAFSVDVDGQERLVLVYEIKNQRLDVNEVFANIRQAISEEHETQVHAIVLLKPNSIPKTSSGKIQRQACRVGFIEGHLDAVAEWSEPPITKDEPATNISQIPLNSVSSIEAWLVAYIANCQSIPQPRIDVSRPPTRYGLDSLSAIELMHHIEIGAGVILPMTVFLQELSLRDLAAKIFEQVTARTTDNPLKPFIVKECDSAYPLSKGQEALWVLYKLASDSAAYNISSALRIRSELNIACLRRAFQALVERHGALRTVFFVEQGEPRQRVGDYNPNCFQTIDASNWGEDELDRRLVEDAYLPFDLERDSLLRIRLFKRSAQEQVLLLVVHHIVSDFWSLAVLLRELGILYMAEITKSPANLEPLSLEYADYVRWQTEMLASHQSERLWSYWREQLKGELPALNLFTDYQRPLSQTYQGASVSVILEEDIARKLKSIACERSATPYMVLLAAFQALLHRYTGQDEIIVGSPVAGRNHAQLAGLVGYFVNLLVLRANFSEGPTFEVFLRQVRQLVLDAFEHQDYPFSLLVERLRPEHDASASPLFQAAFVMQKAALPELKDLGAFALGLDGVRLEFGGLAFESIALEERATQFDLAMMVADAGDKLAVCLQYNTDLYETQTMRRMISHYHLLLEAIATDARQAVSSLPLLSSAEERQLLVEWNETVCAYPQRGCIHEFFESQAQRTPEAVAVCCEEQQLSYRELNKKAGQLAGHLQALGVGPDVLVGLCMERSSDMAVGLLGILRAGGAYAPLDPDYPAERLAYMLQDSRAAIVLTQEKYEDKIGSILIQGAKLVTLDKQCPEVSKRVGALKNENTELRREVKPDHLAYVIYTSGTTGNPKGVAVTHQSVCNQLCWAEAAFNFSAADRFLQKASLSFDASVVEIFLPLVAGGQLIMAKAGGERDVEYLVKLMAEAGITCIDLPPTLLQALLVHPRITSCNSARLVISGGETLRQELVEAFKLRLPHAQLWNTYGPTETTVQSTFADNLGSAGTVPIGKPLANTQVYVTDRAMNVQPVGVGGEIFIGGAGLARGYWERPDLTAAKFVPDPNGFVAGARLYRTGDLGRYLPNGTIEFLGRLDHQVKLRGYRIELGEIESALAQHDLVSEAVVTVQEDDLGDKRLIAYIVVGRGNNLSIAELREYLKRILPSYMMPAAYVLLDELPLTSNGKLDRKALPPPDAARPELTTNLVPPRDQLEEVLSKRWSRILGIEEIGVYDNFFELGGHSVLATQMITQLQEIFPTNLPLLTLFFQDPTIVGLSQAIRQGMADEEETRNIVHSMNTLDQLSDEQVNALLFKLEIENAPRMGTP